MAEWRVTLPLLLGGSKVAEPRALRLQERLELLCPKYHPNIAANRDATKMIVSLDRVSAGTEALAKGKAEYWLLRALQIARLSKGPHFRLLDREGITVERMEDADAASHHR